MGDPKHSTDEALSGLPPDQPEEQPLGVPEARPDADEAPPRGPDAMPGIPSDGDPPDAG
jgi:hypothetical protein